MKMFRSFFAITLLAALAVPAANAVPAGSAITYQGKLKSSGLPVNTSIPMSFSLWDQEAGGAQIGGTATFPSVPVTNGVFTVVLNFGDTVFNGEVRWLQIVVDGETLAPRQALTAAPYASLALEPWKLNGTTTYYNGGNVGVGATAPAAKLEVLGGVAATSQNLTHHQGAHLEWNKAGGDGATWLLNQKGLGSGGIIFGEVTTANAITERMRIAANGRLGIGTTAPSAQLHTTEIMQSDVGLRFGDPGMNSDLMYIARVNPSNDHSQLYIGLGDNPGQAPNPGDELIIDAGGSAQFIFRSNGDAYKTGFPAWGTISDELAKHDIESLTNTGVLDRLLKLKGRTFFYNEPDQPGAAGVVGVDDDRDRVGPGGDVRGGPCRLQPSYVPVAENDREGP